MSSPSLAKTLKKNIIPLISKVIEEGGNYALTRKYIESYPGQIFRFDHKVYTDRLLEMNKQGQWMGGKTLSRSEVTKIVTDIFNAWKKSEEAAVTGYKKDLFLPGTGKETIRVTKERFKELKASAAKKANAQYLTAVCRNYYYMQQFTSAGKEIKLNLIRRLNDIDGIEYSKQKGKEGKAVRERFNFQQDLGHGAGEGIAASGLASARAIGSLTNHKNKIVRDVMKKEKYMTEILEILVGYDVSLEHATNLSDKKFFKDYELVLTTQDAKENKAIDAPKEKALIERLRDVFEEIILDVQASKSLREMVNEQFFSYFEHHKNLQVSGKKGRKKLDFKTNASERFKAKQKSPVPLLIPAVKFKSKNIGTEKKSKHRNAKRGVNPLGLLMLLNKKLPEKVQQKMGLPGLTNRTGKFAESAKAVNITDTNEGVPVIDYTYEKNPYQVFETGKGQKPWSTMQRDPRTIIDRSIRELAAEMALGKFTTRRV